MSTSTAITILADDLSGAAEAAAAFLGRTPAPTLALHPGPMYQTGVTVVDLNNRTRSAPDADSALRAALGTIGDDHLVLVKIDSLHTAVQDLLKIENGQPVAGC